MGWFKLNLNKSFSNKNYLDFTNILNEEDSYYFIHSYFVNPNEGKHIVATYNFGGHEIPAIVSKDYIIGKVIWKSGFTNENNTIMDKNLFEQDFEIAEFLSRGLKSEPNLFSDESDGMLNEDIKKKRA